jgi:hypothetical protein
MRNLVSIDEYKMGALRIQPFCLASFARESGSSELWKPNRGRRPHYLGLNGGESGIRTHVRVSPKHAFQACAFSHSAISPAQQEAVLRF